MRPIVEIMFSDFMLVAMDQIVNQMAKVCYMSGGQKNVPMVIRTTIGAGRAAAAQHSQNLNAVIAHFPGSKIVIPSDAYTAKGLLKSAIRDNNPVIVVEHRKHYSVEFDMPDDGDENLLLPIGKSVVVHEGSDVTVVANSFRVGQCVKVAKHLEKKKGVSVEVVDLRTLVPLDKETIIKSVKKTGVCPLWTRATPASAWPPRSVPRFRMRCSTIWMRPSSACVRLTCPSPSAPPWKNSWCPMKTPSWRL